MQARKQAEEEALAKEKEDLDVLQLEIKEAKVALTAANERSQSGVAYKVRPNHILIPNPNPIHKPNRGLQGIPP